MTSEYGESDILEVTMDGPFGNAGVSVRAEWITLNTEDWKNASSPYYQVVSVAGSSINSKIDIQVTHDQAADLCNNGIALLAQNKEGTITVYALGGKPGTNLTVQATIMDITASGVIWGDMAGAPMDAMLKEINDLKKDKLGKSGGSMTGNIAMDGHRVTGIPDPVAGTDAVNADYVNSRTEWLTTVLPASGWSESAPYSQTVAVEGVTAEKPPHVSPVYSDAGIEDLQEACSCVTYAVAGADQLTVVCLTDKPSVDIPIQVEVHK